MKKILIAGALLSAISTTALAEVGMVYFRIDAGASMLTNPASDGNYFAQKFEGRNTPFINLGLGWTVMDNVRTDVNFSYLFNDKFTANALKAAEYAPAAPLTTPASDILADATHYPALALPTGTVTDGAVPANAAGFVGTSATVAGVAGAAPTSAATAGLGYKFKLSNVSGVSVQDTIKAFSVMPRVYFDLFDYGGGKFFVGAALGYANVQYQSDVTVSYTEVAQGTIAGQVNNGDHVNANAIAKPADQTVTLKSPTSGNFAFGLHAGMDYKIPSWEGVKLNLEYSYTNYGQVKKLTVGGTDVVLKNPINVNMNNLSLGLRIEM